MKRLFSFLLPLALAGTLCADSSRIVGISVPNTHCLFTVDESLLEKISLKKGGWCEVDQSTFEKVVEQIPSPSHIFGENRTHRVIKGLASLGIPSTLYPTDSHIACFVTPDGETSLCVSKQSKKLIINQLENVELVHIDGRLICSGVVAERVMQQAKEAKTVISLDLVNPAIVKKFRERLWALLTTYVDIVFLNEKEAYALTHLPPKQACSFLKNFCKIAVVISDDEGCWVGSEEHLLQGSVTPGEDHQFFCGFLYSYLQHHPLETCVQFGNPENRAVLKAE